LDQDCGERFPGLLVQDNAVPSAAGFFRAGVFAGDVDGTDAGHGARGLHVGGELVHLGAKLVEGDEPGGVQGQDKYAVHLFRAGVWIDESGPGEDTGEHLNH